MDATERTAFAEGVKQRVKALDKLPPLPEVAAQLLDLRSRGGDLQTLVNVLNKDAALAIQVMSFARAPIFGYGDRIKSVDQAISLVHGYDRALNMAIGFAAGKTLNMPMNGPLGRAAFWKNSLITATVAQKLAALMPSNQRPDTGLCYLAGLIHNFGVMLLAHLYPREFAELNTLFEEVPGQDLRELELRCFGVSHDFIGMWLMRAWNMPEELVVAVAEHHFPDYDGKHAVYAKITALASCFSDRSEDDHPCMAKETAASMGLTPEKIAKVLEQTHDMDEDLNSLACLLAA